MSLTVAHSKLMCLFQRWDPSYSLCSCPVSSLFVSMTPTLRKRVEELGQMGRGKRETHRHPLALSLFPSHFAQQSFPGLTDLPLKQRSRAACVRKPAWIESRQVPFQKSTKIKRPTLVALCELEASLFCLAVTRGR